MVTREEAIAELERRRSQITPEIARAELLRRESEQQPDIETPTESIPRTVLDQGLQGATFGFADEITDPLGVALATLIADPEGFIKGEISDPALAEQVAQARRTTQERLDRQFEQRPVTSVGSQIGGALLTGGAGATTKAGARAGNILRSGNLPARIAKSSTAGAASGATFGAGTAEEGERLEGATEGAILGGVAGGAIPVVASTGRAINRALGKKQIIPNSDELKKQAGRLYQIADQKGGILTSKFSDDFVDEVNKLRPQTQEGQLIAGKSDFTKVIDDIQGIRNRRITLQAAQEIDEELGNKIDNFFREGRLTKEGKKLFDVQTTFRNMIEEADDDLVEGGKEGFEALKEARKLWATSRKLADIEKIIERADLMDNPATAIKSGFRMLLKNPNRIKGFTKVEKEAIRKAAQTGVVTDTLRVMSSRLIPIITVSTGGGVGGTTAATAASLAARNAATRAQVRQAQKVAEIVANQGNPITRAPLIGSPSANLLLPNVSQGALTGRSN